jgi:predicted AlkP superfamily pyrophosphatase or phosphodiesterase
MNNALACRAPRSTSAGPGRRFRRLALAVVTALPLFLTVPPGRAQEPNAALVPKVLLVGIDGVRPDVMRQVVTPNLNELIRHGAFSDRAQTGLPTLSGPSWTSMLTGVWKEKHGVLSNDFPFPDAALSRYPDFLTRIERMDPRLRTFAAADWTPLMEPQEDGEERGDPVLGTAIDVRISLDGSKIGWAAADERAVEAAEAELRANDPAALFVYLGNPDEVSHHTGSIEDEYRASIARADRHVGRLMAAIRARPSYATENWLILVSTDHGRRPDGGHGGSSVEERTIFLIASGPSARQGMILTPPRIVDVAATALAHLGLTPREEWGLDGAPVGLVGW